VTGLPSAPAAVEVDAALDRLPTRAGVSRANGLRRHPAQVPARLASGSVILLALFACTSDPPQATSRQAATQQEIAQAQQDYASCLHRAAADLDDGRSAAASVARAVRSYCIPEYERVVDFQSKDLNPEARQIFRQKAQARELEETTAAVLQERSERKAPDP